MARNGTVAKADILAQGVRHWCGENAHATRLGPSDLKLHIAVMFASPLLPTLLEPKN